jgi:hypothetical protein
MTRQTQVFLVESPNFPKQNWRMSTSHVILGANDDLSKVIGTRDALQEVSVSRCHQITH